MIHFRELRHKPDQTEVIYWLGSLCQSSVSEISYFQSTAFNNVLLDCWVSYNVSHIIIMKLYKYEINNKLYKYKNVCTFLLHIPAYIIIY